MFKIKKTKPVSIIIISCNKKEYIEECIESVLSQKIEKEIICIDDASADGTYEILQEYSKKYNELKVYQNKENLGTVLSRYNGLTHCEGEYMLFVDADDILIPNTLLELYKEAVLAKTDILEFSSETDGSDKLKQTLKRSEQKIYSDILQAYQDKKITNQLWNKMISKKVYKKALKKMNQNLKQVNYSDVVYFLYHFLQNAKNITTTETLGYFYYDKRGMTSNLNNVERLKQYCGFNITKRELIEVYGYNEILENIWNIVCNQAVVTYLELSEQEQKKYKHLLEELMTEEQAQFLIEGHLEMRNRHSGMG